MTDVAATPAASTQVDQFVRRGSPAGQVMDVPNVIVEADGELPPPGSQLQEMTRRNVAGGSQCLVCEEVNRRTSGTVVRDRKEVRDGNAVLIALDPAPVMAAVEVHKPFAQRSNDRHSWPRITVGKLQCIREVRRT
jgi:hypothetical protein